MLLINKSTIFILILLEVKLKKIDLTYQVSPMYKVKKRSLMTPFFYFNLLIYFDVIFCKICSNTSNSLCSGVLFRVTKANTRDGAFSIGLIINCSLFFNILV